MIQLVKLFGRADGLADDSIEMARAGDRVAKRPVGLVHARRPLQRGSALGVAGMREAIGMHARLDLAVGPLERYRVELEPRGEAEQLEVTARR